MQLDNTNERLKKFIVKQIAGKFSFSKEERKFRLSLRDIQQSDRDRIKDEIRKAPEWRQQTEANIERFIRETTQSTSLCYNIRTVSSPILDIKSVECGHVVNLLSEDERCGKAELKIMALGNNGNVATRWFVISSTRLAIHPEDILETYDTTLWSVGHSVAFKVFRGNKRIPEGEAKVYQTYPLTSITHEMPSIIHEIIDARNDFTYEELIQSQKTHKSLQLTATRAAMSLLLHEYSEQMPFYLDFEEDGVTAIIAMGGKSSLTPQDKELVCETSHNAQPTDQWGKGKVKILNETLEMVVIDKIKEE